MAFHAFFGLSLMQSAALIGPDWWHALGQTDDAALLADQWADLATQLDGLARSLPQTLA